MRRGDAIRCPERNRNDNPPYGFIAMDTEGEPALRSADWPLLADVLVQLGLFAQIGVGADEQFGPGRLRPLAAIPGLASSAMSLTVLGSLPNHG